MRIIFLLATLETGGAERQFGQLADALAARGHRISFLTFFPGGAYWDWLQTRPGVEVRSLFGFKPASRPGKAIQLLTGVIHLRRILDREEKVVIYSAMNFANAMAWPAVRGLSRVRLVWGIRASNMALKWYQAAPLHLCAWVSKSTPLLIANSRSGMAYHEGLGYRCPRRVIVPNGIDVDRFQPDAGGRKRIRAEWGIDDGETVIGMAARLDPTKDHPTFLKAAAQMARMRDRVRFVCVGDGPPVYQAKMKALALAAGLGSRLIWVGSCLDMPAVYSAFDVYTSTSISEAFSNTIGEAMACGARTVVTDVGDSAWLVGRTGRVVPPGSPDDVCRAWIETLDRQPGEDNLDGRRRIIEHFSLKTMVDRTETLLAEVWNEM